MSKSEESSMVKAKRTGEHLFYFPARLLFLMASSLLRPVELWEHEHRDMVSSQLWLTLDNSAEGLWEKKLNLEAEREQRPRSKTSKTQEWKEGALQICLENSFSDGLFCFMWLLRCCFVNLNREQTMSSKHMPWTLITFFLLSFSLSVYKCTYKHKQWQLDLFTFFFFLGTMDY